MGAQRPHAYAWSHACVAGLGGRLLTAQPAGIRMLDRCHLSFGLTRELLRTIRDDDARQLASRPDVDGAVEINGLVQGTPLEADLLRPFRVTVTKAGSAGRAEIARKRAPAVGCARPAFQLTRQQPHVGASHDDRDAEGRRRLLLTLAAVADVGFVRRTCQFVADRAALAATTESGSTA